MKKEVLSSYSTLEMLIEKKQFQDRKSSEIFPGFTIALLNNFDK